MADDGLDVSVQRADRATLREIARHQSIVQQRDRAFLCCPDTEAQDGVVADLFEPIEGHTPRDQTGIDNQVVAGAKIGDRVIAETVTDRLTGGGVNRRSQDKAKPIAQPAARQNIVTQPAVQSIKAVATVQAVITGQSKQVVVTAQTQDRVITCRTVDLIAAIRTGKVHRNVPLYFVIY